jgi:hypothetical protein
MIPPRITLSVQEFDETKAKTERAQSKGAPGLAFCDLRSVQPIPHGNPNLSFVIPSEAEGSAVSAVSTSKPHLAPKQICHLEQPTRGGESGKQ